MLNTFFKPPYTDKSIRDRLLRLKNGKVGFYSVGLYPVSIAYNCAMHNEQNNLMLAPRPGRDLFGAFSENALKEMNESYINKILGMSNTVSNGKLNYNKLSTLLLNCELVILSSNSNHIEQDLETACTLRKNLNREDVVLVTLVGSFSYDKEQNKAYILCEKEYNLGFFSGFHRHGALLNPDDSFTANFCHPDALTSFIGSKLLNSISPNIQVSSGVHNIEGQYIKAAKNISSIFAGFGHTYHHNNPGLLPTILTLLLDQCLDQAASVSMCRTERDKLYQNQIFPLTELGYGVQFIEASLLREGNLHQVRDHTFSQLKAMVADVKGSMMLPMSGKPTRNFQAGQVLAKKMINLKRCPNNIEELISWCEESDLRRGGLEGLNSLRYWPQIIKNYSIPVQDASMINLLYMAIYANANDKKIIFNVLTDSRELTNFCQESILPDKANQYSHLLSNLGDEESSNLILSLLTRNCFDIKKVKEFDYNESTVTRPYKKAIKIIESKFT